jgi:hypothetical protein
MKIKNGDKFITEITFIYPANCDGEIKTIHGEFKKKK